MVEDDGIEPPTPACKAGALPAELILHLPGNVLLSQGQLPSALESLTSVFGMGTGVTSLPSLPTVFI